MDRLQQIKNKRIELLRRMNENIAKIDELVVENQDLTRMIHTLERKEEEIEKKDAIENFKKLAAKSFPNGYTIYKAILETDYIGTDQVEIIVWDNAENIVELEDILIERAKENAISYGYTLEEDLPMLCEEYGCDDENELIDQLNLEISGYGYYYEEVKINDLDTYEIEDMIDRFL